MSPEHDDPAVKCPVDHSTRERWLAAAKAKGPSPPGRPPPTLEYPVQRLPTRFSLDTLTWQFSQPTPTLSSLPIQRTKEYRLSTEREISSIPRSLPTNHDREAYKAAERAASTSCNHLQQPANSEKDTGHDTESGNWIYPSQEMFFAAMKRKGHSPDSADMATIVPIHNAVNERAWAEIKQWEAGRGAEKCGGPKLVSFGGNSKKLTPKALWNTWVRGYTEPFDRHDWVVDRCGKHVDYVIDFYSGKNEGVMGKGLNFFLDVRPKLNSWEGIKMRVEKILGL
ncbi:hypothetical protein M433DRAFT_155871 [Acidomyces richmondensis BFW]|nr:MAG: hypothetical protein FE78DRAFT_92585 [Acidomyces sp. 'richmondensis']KYG44186.1 hypothetical protein M433DRAFT_155871 [Acidomyces richmondensis BFW]